LVVTDTDLLFKLRSLPPAFRQELLRLVAPNGEAEGDGTAEQSEASEAPACGSDRPGS
jgi:hypothetical protein